MAYRDGLIQFRGSNDRRNVSSKIRDSDAGAFGHRAHAVAPQIKCQDGVTFGRKVICLWRKILSVAAPTMNEYVALAAAPRQVVVQLNPSFVRI